MGLPENWVHLNPLVNCHYPSKYHIVGMILYRLYPTRPTICIPMYIIISLSHHIISDSSMNSPPRTYSCGVVQVHFSTPTGEEPQPGFPNCCVHWISLMMEPTKHGKLQSPSRLFLEILVYVCACVCHCMCSSFFRCFTHQSCLFKRFFTYHRVNWHRCGKRISSTSLS